MRFRGLYFLKDIKIFGLMILIPLMLITLENLYSPWFIYHKPAIEGMIIDKDSRQPLEGVVAVAYYYKSTWWVMGNDDTLIMVKETLSDKKGSFKIPSYTTLIHPMSTASYMGVLFYRPGYVPFWYETRKPISGDIFYRTEKSYFRENSIELSKLTSKEERIKRVPDQITDNDIDKPSYLKNQKLLIDLIDKERDDLCLEELYLPRLRKFIQRYQNINRPAYKIGDVGYDPSPGPGYSVSSISSGTKMEAILQDPKKGITKTVIEGTELEDGWRVISISEFIVVLERVTKIDKCQNRILRAMLAKPAPPIVTKPIAPMLRAPSLSGPGLSRRFFPPTSKN
jgi:hypothetical protein